jgi:ribosomal protein S18 acetylase RimI-like enzyme
MHSFDPPFRRATLADARAIAQLTAYAGEGIPDFFWAEESKPGETPLDIGARRAARTGVNFCYENAIVGDDNGRVSAVLLGYPIDDTDPGDLSDMSPLVHPLCRLECLAPGSWYINVMAVMPDYRRQGLGGRLLRLADALARAEGRGVTSLIVSSENPEAKRLYESNGFRILASEPSVAHPKLKPHGDWLLMTRSVSG